MSEAKTEQNGMNAKMKSEMQWMSMRGEIEYFMEIQWAFPQWITVKCLRKIPTKWDRERKRTNKNRRKIGVSDEQRVQWNVFFPHCEGSKAMETNKEGESEKRYQTACIFEIPRRNTPLAFLILCIFPFFLLWYFSIGFFSCSKTNRKKNGCIPFRQMFYFISLVEKS